MIPFKVDLRDKIIAVTGAGGVICSEFAKALAECGAKVALLDINYERTKEYAEEIGESAIAVKCNCLNKEEIRQAKKEINEKFGRVNFLINGAGGNNAKATCDNEYMTRETEGIKDFFALEESGLKFVFDLNITSAFLVTQVFAEDMVKRGGNIINISSMNAYRPLTKIPAYSAAKAGISNFTQWLAVHFAPCNIRCNAIAPGFFVTNQNRGLLYNADGTETERTGENFVGDAYETIRENKRFNRLPVMAGGRQCQRFRDGNGHSRGRRLLRLQRRLTNRIKIFLKNF